MGHWARGARLSLRCDYLFTAFEAGNLHLLQCVGARLPSELESSRLGDRMREGTVDRMVDGTVDGMIDGTIAGTDDRRVDGMVDAVVCYRSSIINVPR
jgi:hypothetical protein